MICSVKSTSFTHQQVSHSDMKQKINLFPYKGIFFYECTYIESSPRDLPERNLIMYANLIAKGKCWLTIISPLFLSF